MVNTSFNPEVISFHAMPPPRKRHASESDSENDSADSASSTPRSSFNLKFNDEKRALYDCEPSTVMAMEVGQVQFQDLTVDEESAIPTSSSSSSISRSSSGGASRHTSGFFQPGYVPKEQGTGKRRIQFYFCFTFTNVFQCTDDNLRIPGNGIPDYTSSDASGRIDFLFHHLRWKAGFACCT